MGIDTGAMLIYGLPYEEMYEAYESYIEQNPDKDIDFQDWIEECGFDSASPYYDSSYSDKIFGITIVHSGDYSYCETTFYEIDVDTQDAERDFVKLTGKCGNLYISPDVT